jgi:hypothetical protein
LTESQFREFQKVNKILKSNNLTQDKSRASSRSARRIIEEYVEMPDPEDLEMHEEEQDILDATSRHSRSLSPYSGTTPPQNNKNSVRQDLKFAY